MDNHDEPMVSGRFTPWLHEEPMFVMEVIAETVHTTVEASPTRNGRRYKCIETARTIRSMILRGFRSKSLCPLLQLFFRPAGVEERVPIPGEMVASNRFFCFATDSEDEQIEQRTLFEDTCSDTVNVVGQRNSGRQLRLRWSKHTPPVNATSNVQVPDVLDSHDRRLMRVRAASGATVETGNRSGQVSGGACWTSGSGSRCAQSHWSPTVVSFQHSSLWAAATGNRSLPVLQWLAQSAQHLSIPVCDVEMPGHDAVMAGWEALHQH